VLKPLQWIAHSPVRNHESKNQTQQLCFHRSFRAGAKGVVCRTEPIGILGKAPLAQREETVANLVAEGMTNRETARKLALVSVPSASFSNL
jgi:DNA-binding NarL/FixJ family response regulator